MSNHPLSKRVDASSVARKLCLEKDRDILTLLAVHFELDQKNPGWKWSCFRTCWETLALVINMNLFVVDVRIGSHSLSGLQYLNFKRPICFMICVSWPFMETGSPFSFEKYCEFDCKTNMKELDINIPNKPNISTTNGNFWHLAPYEWLMKFMFENIGIIYNRLVSTNRLALPSRFILLKNRPKLQLHTGDVTDGC